MEIPWAFYETPSLFEIQIWLSHLFAISLQTKITLIKQLL